MCRDHLNNVLFEAEVKDIDDEKVLAEECRRYADGTWVDYVVED